MQHIYFMRHGETSYNLSGRIQGRTDIPLNENGLKEARMAGEYFAKLPVRFDRVFSSPLDRAVTTASIAGQVDRSDISIDNRIIEMNFGVCEGMPVPDLPQGVLNLFSRPEKYTVPDGGETIEEVISRCGSFLGSMGEFFDSDHAVENVLAVSHGAALRGIISSVTGSSISEFWTDNLENCCTLKISYRDGVYNIEEYLHPLGGTAYMIPPWKRNNGWDEQRS